MSPGILLINMVWYNAKSPGSPDKPATLGFRCAVQQEDRQIWNRYTRGSGCPAIARKVKLHQFILDQKNPSGPAAKKTGPIPQILKFEDKTPLYDLRRPICGPPKTNMWKRSFCFRAAQLLEILPMPISNMMQTHTLEAFQRGIKIFLLSRMVNC